MKETTLKLFLLSFMVIIMTMSCNSEVKTDSYTKIEVKTIKPKIKVHNSPVETICIRGVEYYTLYYRLAPAFKPDGSLYTCTQ